jgi:hypothetical protein
VTAVYSEELLRRLIDYADANPDVANKAWRIAGELSDSIDTQEREYFRALLRIQAGWNYLDGALTAATWEHAARCAMRRTAELLNEANDFVGLPGYQGALRAQAYEQSKEATEYFAAARKAAEFEAWDYKSHNGSLPDTCEGCGLPETNCACG